MHVVMTNGSTFNNVTLLCFIISVRVDGDSFRFQKPEAPFLIDIDGLILFR